MKESDAKNRQEMAVSTCLYVHLSQEDQEGWQRWQRDPRSRHRLCHGAEEARL